MRPCIGHMESILIQQVKHRYIITISFTSLLSCLGNIYIADFGHSRIRKVTVSTGVITTLAGTGTDSNAGDNGPATAASLSSSRGVALDTLGNVYIADQGSNRIRKVTISSGILSTIAGNTTASYSGDNGQATSATLKSPSGVALDSSGNFLMYTCMCMYI